LLRTTSGFGSSWLRREKLLGFVSLRFLIYFGFFFVVAFYFNFSAEVRLQTSALPPPQNEPGETQRLQPRNHHLPAPGQRRQGLVGTPGGTPEGSRDRPGGRPGATHPLPAPGRGCSAGGTPRLPPDSPRPFLPVSRAGLRNRTGAFVSPGVAVP